MPAQSLFDVKMRVDINFMADNIGILFIKVHNGVTF